MQANVPVNVGGSLLLLIVFLLLALMGILAMSLLVNLITGRFAPRNLVLSKTIEVTFSKEGLKSSDGGPIEFGDLVSDNAVAISGERLREFSLPSGSHELHFVAANLHKPLSWVRGLFRGPIASVSASGTTLVTGGATLKVHGPSENGCDVPQDLNEFWVFAVNNVTGQYEEKIGLAAGQDPFSVTGSLTIFVRSGGGSSAVNRVVNTVSRQLGEVAAKFQATRVTQFPTGVSLSGSSSSLSGSTSTPDDDSSFSI